MTRLKTVEKTMTIDFQDVVLFFNSQKFEIMGDVFDELIKFSESNKLEWGYYKDDSFFNSIYVVLPQKDRVVLILCPQSSSRYHCLHFTSERFNKFFEGLQKACIG